MLAARVAPWPAARIAPWPAALVAASLASLASLVAPSLAAADPPPVLLADRWPAVPAGHALTLEDQITERLTLLGNTLGSHLDLLSHDMFQLRVDGRRRRAHIRLGGGDAQRLALQLDSDIQFEDINARVNARIDLAFRGHALHLELPALEMSPAEYRGDRGVEVRLPLYLQRF